MFHDLREFLQALEKDNDLVRIDKPISPDLEMTEIHRRTLHKGGAALIFENPKSDEKTYNMPVLVNLFGTVERVAKALGCEGKDGLRKLGETLATLRSPTPPTSVGDALSKLPLLKKAASSRVKKVKNAKCHEKILKGDDVNLYDLPIQTCWPNEPAPLISWGLVVTKGPNEKDDPTDDYNLGIYRMQVLEKNRTLMRWLKHRGGAQQYKRWKQNKPQDFPAAVVIGAAPAIILASVMPLPDNVSEYKFAGLLAGKRTEVVKCKTSDLLVPASAEIVLEGRVSLSEYADEGPYADHTGYYNSVETFPTFTIDAITMRQNPIYLSTYTGKAPDEPSVLGEALNEIFIPLLQQQFPEICDFWLPPEGCSYRIAIVSIKKAYPGHARRIMMGVWSYLRQFSYTKWVIVVDQNINCRDWKEVMWAVSTKMDPRRDIMLIDDTPIDYLDFASVKDGLGSKAGLDATDKIEPETNREWGKPIYMEKEVIEKIDAIWDSLGIDS